ncbi:MAG: tetratricopeptide repeat protein, partial [Chthoniobacterales bacterium]
MAHQVRRVRRKRRHHNHHRHLQDFFTGRSAIYAGAFIFALLLALLFFNYGPRTYRSWQESRLLKRGTELLQKNDLDGATRAAQEMLRIQPESVAAFQILADASERQNKPDSVAWRAQIARIYPHSLDAQLNLASAALRFGQLDTVRHALENVEPDDRDKAAYHVVAGWLARAEGNDADLEQHFAAAVKQEPTNDLYQFNFAVLQIRSSDPEKKASGRETLERLSKV